MFIDEFIRGYIELNKQQLLEIKDNIHEIKILTHRIKEIIKYLLTYQTQEDYIKIKENFNIVLDNIELLANTLDIKNGTELITLCSFLIHNGYLSEKVYPYRYDDSKKDIIGYECDNVLIYAVNVFSGAGSCRHTATFAKAMLDRFNIQNSLVETYSTDNFELKEKLLAFNNKYKNIGIFHHDIANHLVNYINDNGYEYIADITNNDLLLGYAYNQFAYIFYNDLFKNKNITYPLYNYGYVWYKKINYDEIRTLTIEEQQEINQRVKNAIELFTKNHELFIEFYFQNEKYYHKINKSYGRISEKEKSLRLIKCDK
ncbi:MAG TPA: hypothetical protein IAB38_03295 [Candidatus Onthousia excrementipullorum]|uniref:Uncharacterized protein n=1 Tax=Candidatus Onthousia excrementipullorum TaxID=2840884 RepID=A0A9D1DTY5_9FIRM|nr:hypothetical protein [Candidatus Onthousia excrementipullorum]